MIVRIDWGHSKTLGFDEGMNLISCTTLCIRDIFFFSKKQIFLRRMKSSLFYFINNNFYFIKKNKKLLSSLPNGCQESVAQLIVISLMTLKVISSRHKIGIIKIKIK